MFKAVKLMNKNGKMLLHNIEKCVGCGLCVDICKQLRQALELNSIKTSKIHELRLKTELCAACGFCAFNCPFGALEFYVNSEKVAVEYWLPRGVRFLQKDAEAAENV
jgi:NAD-dependent dihydropyrimidine dehydrogenase PreA subunit